MNRRLFRLAVALMISQCSLARAETVVIEINYGSADEMLPIARSVLGEEGSVAAHGNRLVVNASPAAVGELRSVLTELDQPPKRLLISVDTQDWNQGERQGYQVDGSVSRSRSGNTEADNRVRVISRSTTSRESGVQQVVATAGYPAQIQVGQSVPITSRGTDQYGQPFQQTQHRDLMQGLYAVATVSGDHVRISLSNYRDRLESGQPSNVRLQNTDTVLSGKLGEWLYLGGSSERHESSETGLLRHHSSGGADELMLRVKVELLP